MMKSSNKQVVFTVHPPVEFVYALNFVANDTTLNKFYLDFNFAPDEAFKKNIEEMKSKLSRYIQSELRYFFEWSDMTNVLGRIIVENEAIKSVLDLIHVVEQMPEGELLSLVMKQALYDEKDTNKVLSDGSDSNNMVQLISSIDNKSEEDKEKLMECAENPLEMKTRMRLLMLQFYEKCYKAMEPAILAELASAKERYEKSYQDHPDYFFDEYLCKLAKVKKYMIHISYFTQIRLWTFDIKPHNDMLWINMGIHTEKYPTKVFTRAKVQKLIKILSDNKRFEMIEHLSKKSYYVYELAAELGLTPPTVCYHLNLLTDLNLVRLERANSKTYYTLNKEALKELSKDIAEVLLRE